jgi:hypothetical protein
MMESTMTENSKPKLVEQAPKDAPISIEKPAEGGLQAVHGEEFTNDRW